MECDQAAGLNYGKVKRVVHTAILLHNGWDMDNKGWIVEFDDRRRTTLPTSHDSVYSWTRQDVEEN